MKFLVFFTCVISFAKAQDNIEIKFQHAMPYLGANNKDTLYQFSYDYLITNNNYSLYTYSLCKDSLSGEEIVIGQRNMPKSIFYDFVNKFHFGIYFFKNGTCVAKKYKNISSVQKWVLYEDTLNIMGYKCYKAKTKKNDELVWYTNEIKGINALINYRKIPGIVLYHYNANTLTEYKAINIQKTDLIIKIPNNLKFVNDNWISKFIQANGGWADICAKSIK